MRKSRFFLVLAAFAATACSRSGKKSGPLVAEGDGVAVTAEEFKARLDEQSPFIRARYSALDRKKEFLENLIRFELLAKEAQKRGLDKDPEVQATLKKIMVQKLVRQSFDEGESKVSDAEAQKYYDERKDEFVKPERVRVSVVVLRAPQGSPNRTAKAAEAKKLLAKLKADEQKNPLAFSSLARESSDDQMTKAAGGDAGYRTQEELGTMYAKEVATAAFALKDVGQESSVVDFAQGFAIVKLTARQAPMNRSFDEVKAQLTARIGRERRTKEFDEHVKKLREKSSIKVNDAELEKIVVAAPQGGAQPAMATGAPPGMMVPPNGGAVAGPNVVPVEAPARR